MHALLGAFFQLSNLMNIKINAKRNQSKTIKKVFDAIYKLCSAQTYVHIN